MVLTAPDGARSQTTAPPGYQAVKTAQLHPGVEYVKLAKAEGPVVAHVAHVQPGAPVDLQVISAHNRIPDSAGDLETTSSMCRRVQCIAGVNGDFHRFGVPAGAVILDGRMLRSPEPDRPQLTVTKNGRLMAGTFPWTGTLTAPNGRQIPVTRVNAAPPANELAVFTPELGAGTDGSSRVELVVKTSAVGTLNRSTKLELVSLRTGAGPIPTDGAVLSGDGAAGQQLRELWEKRQTVTGPVRLQISSPVDAYVSLGVEPVVLKDGKRATPWRDPNVINPTQPHTLIGWNNEGHVYLVAVDGRQPASEGVNMAQAADFLLSLGVTDAVSLDGGGGTVFVAEGSVWNRPSDNDPSRPGGFIERGAPNAFLLVASPVGPAPTTPAPQTIKPMSIPEEEADSPEESDVVSTPLSAGPTTLNGDPLIDPGLGLPAAQPPVAHSAGQPPTQPGPGREATAGDASPAGTTGEDRSPATAASSPQGPDGDPSPSNDADQAALAADTVARADQPAGTGRRWPRPLTTVLAGAALATVLGLARRTRGRNRQSPARVQKAAAGDEVAALNNALEVRNHEQPPAVLEDPVENSEHAVAADAPVERPDGDDLHRVGEAVDIPTDDECAATAVPLAVDAVSDVDDDAVPAAGPVHPIGMFELVLAERAAVIDARDADADVIAPGSDLSIERELEPIDPSDSASRTAMFRLSDPSGFHCLALGYEARARIRAERIRIVRTERARVASQRPTSPMPKSPPRTIPAGNTALPAPIAGSKPAS